MYYTTQYASPLGIIGLACNDEALVCLWLPGQPPFRQDAEALPHAGLHPVLAQIALWLDRYFAGERMDVSGLPLAPEGSAFRQIIWKLLLEIPYGQATTYGELAKQAAVILGKPRMSAQAVGGAVGANPISILIPCHRCLGAGGTLTGYAGGLQLKRFLLCLENIQYKD